MSVTETSYYRNAQLPKCPVTEMSVTKTSVTKVSVTEMSGYHLKQCLNLDATVEAVETRFDTYASFHITCECPDPSVFMSDDLWPEEAFVRWWREPKHLRPATKDGANLP